MNADKIGHYDFIPRINNAILNRGEFLLIQVFITGYGQIENSKFVFYPSIDIIDPTNSSVSYGLKFDPADSNRIVGFGSQKTSVDESGVIVSFSALPGEKSPYFFEWNFLGGNTPQILSETEGNRTVPIELKLKIRDHASSGNHFLNFAFTYFNGKEWTGSNQQIPFTIRNIFQEREILVSWLVFAATILTILASIIPSIQLLKKIYFFLMKRILPKKQNEILQQSSSTSKTPTKKTARKKK